MAKWEIDPEGVAPVLMKTVHTASAFGGQLQQFGAAIEGGIQQSASGIVAQAIVDFVDRYRGDIAFVVERTGSAVTGAYNATVAYLEGDEEMAANAQAQAGVRRSGGKPAAPYTPPADPTAPQ